MRALPGRIPAVSGETTMGGGPSRFPATSLSLLAAPDQIREHLTLVCRRYWRPVYFYIRRRWTKSNDEAKDLAQGFFLHLLERGGLDGFDPRRGNFRTYLRQCLQNFLVSDHRARTRVKRGGGESFVSVEQLESVLASPAPDPAEDPEAAFDRDWVSQLLRDAVDELGALLRSRGREKILKAFRLYDLSDGEPPSYDDLARAIDAKRSDIGNFLRAARRELRRIVVKNIGEYVGDEREILSEEERILRLLG
jgi:RNA polymerase sigma factor (sigma-70 family)